MNVTNRAADSIHVPMLVVLAPPLVLVAPPSPLMVSRRRPKALCHARGRVQLSFGRSNGGLRDT